MRDITGSVILVVDAAHPERLAVPAAGVADGLIGLDHLRVTHLAGDPKFRGQVGGADEQHVHA